MNRCPYRRLTGIMLATVALLLIAACGAPSGNQIVFVSDIDGDPEIFLLDPKTGKTTRLTDNGSQDLNPRWSPDGSLIVYLSDESGDMEINVVDRKKAAVNRLTYTSGEEGPPLWSPDGRRFAFVSRRDGNSEIYSMDPATNEQSRLTFTPSEDRLGDWSPDGEWLVFSADGEGSESGLWLRNPDGVNLIQITEGADSDPAWSPDNSRIAFVRETEPDVGEGKSAGRNSDIFVVVRPGSGRWQDASPPLRLTQHETTQVSPLWSPDGEYLAFVSYQDGNAEIYTMKADGSKQRRLTNNSAQDLDPVWSPDGKHIAFVSYLYGPGEIIAMEFSGGRQYRLTSDLSDDTSPDW